MQQIIKNNMVKFGLSLIYISYFKYCYRYVNRPGFVYNQNSSLILKPILTFNVPMEALGFRFSTINSTRSGNSKDFIYSYVIPVII